MISFLGFFLSNCSRLPLSNYFAILWDLYLGGTFQRFNDSFVRFGKLLQFVESHDLLQRNETLGVLWGFILQILIFGIVDITEVVLNLSFDGFVDVFTAAVHEVCEAFFRIFGSSFCQLSLFFIIISSCWDLRYRLYLWVKSIYRLLKLLSIVSIYDLDIHADYFRKT